MTTSIERPLALVILDGWGVGEATAHNAVRIAHTPYFDAIIETFPSCAVSGATGLSGRTRSGSAAAEVGHMMIGTGRSGFGDGHRIEQAIASGEFEQNAVIRTQISDAIERGGTIHLIGMVSDGGVHSFAGSLYSLLRMSRKAGASDVAVHCILDGVDTSPRTADIHLEALEIKMADIGIGRIASIVGRHFAMDTGGHWERSARVYTMLVHGEGERAEDAVTAVRNSFLRGIADEFVAPVVIVSAPDHAVATVKTGDLVIYFNHRPETMHQLVRSLSLPDNQGAPKPEIASVCLTEYDRGFGLPVAFGSGSVDSLTDVLGSKGIAVVKVTQAERYPHLTYFFNGAGESLSQLERNVLVPAPRDDLDLIGAESRSFKIADEAIGVVRNGGSLLVVNMPAAALAAESGSFERTVEAVQFVDTCLGGLWRQISAEGGQMVVTASHGGCENITETDLSDTERSPELSGLPLCIAGLASGRQLRSDGSLPDIAPTLLEMAGIAPTPEMTGRSLLR